jgi:membrane fusion protein, multidrug efflux system
MEQERRQDKPVPPMQNGDPNGMPRQASPADNDQDITSVPLYRRWKAIVPTLVVLTALVVGGWYWYLGQRDFVSTDDAYIDADRVSVSSKILGRIERLTVDEGDTVNAGQVLVQLDPSDLMAQHSQASASQILAKENVNLARVSLAKAQQDFDRAQAQHQDKIITDENYDHAQKSLEEAKAKYAIATAQVGMSGAQISVIDTQLQNTTIEAPMHGVVSKRWALPGDVVSPGQPIFTIFNTDSVWATANLEETKLSALKPGDSVEIKVDAYPKSVFRGRVSQLGANTASQFSLIPPNNASGNFTKVTQRVPVKILIERTDPAGVPRESLLPGMSVEVRVKVR